MTTRYELVTILGPTASGKTSVAVALAQALNGEILSADSRQVYRNMDIGTGKDLQEYSTPLGTVPVHLTDIAEAGEAYDLFRFVNDFFTAFEGVVARGRQPIMCGGSGMYLDAIIRGYNLKPVPWGSEQRQQLEMMSNEALIRLLQQHKPLHNTTDTLDRTRLMRALEIALAERSGVKPKPITMKSNITHLVFGIDIPRAKLRERITHRLRSRLHDGLVEEVEMLLAKGLEPDQLRYYGLEYRYLTNYVLGLITFDEMESLLNTAIHQFAKRQMTWFRRMEKNNIPIHWITGDRDAAAIMTEMLEVINH